jgi:putative glutamine amidotransferase
MRPLIGIPSCVKELDSHAFYAVHEKYVAAAIEASGGVAMLIPAVGPRQSAGELADRLDGLLLPGSPSDVAPSRYGGPDSYPDQKQDLLRDSTTLPLILAAIEQGLPIFAICRGLQELNVAFGGTLHQALHHTDGMLDHRSPRNASIDEKYGRIAHPVCLAQGGELNRLLGQAEIGVNSLHRQGLDRLGDGLAVEATAPDGLVEAVRVIDSRAFALGVQWHPEFRALENPISRELFAAFGKAAGARATARAGAPKHFTPVRFAAAE